MLLHIAGRLPGHAAPCRRMRPARHVVRSKGFGSRQSGQPQPQQPTDSVQKVQRSRQLQLRATDVLARLLEAPDLAAAADECVDYMDQDFFVMADAYMAMASRARAGGSGGRRSWGGISTATQRQQQCADATRGSPGLQQCGPCARAGPDALTAPHVAPPPSLGRLADERGYHAAAGAPSTAQARKEGSALVARRLEAAIHAAMEAKQRTLRPEIQLLNRLLALESAEQREQALREPAGQEALVREGGYFFHLVERMAADVAAQPPGPRSTPLLLQLRNIQREAAGATPGKD